MSVKRLSNNKYKITIELGYDALGNRRRKTETFHGTKTEANKREAELTKKFYHSQQMLMILKKMSSSKFQKKH